MLVLVFFGKWAKQLLLEKRMTSLIQGYHKADLGVVESTLDPGVRTSGSGDSPRSLTQAGYVF